MDMNIGETGADRPGQVSLLPCRRGWIAVAAVLIVAIGLLVASALFAFFLNTLSAPDFLDWGWRYPFFVAFAINVVALFAASVILLILPSVL